MIPKAYIIQWRDYAPWASDDQVEQDLVLSRILCELYSEPFIADNLLFRGGTALHKLYFPIAARYSEDIDLVQIHAQPIGTLADAIRKKLDPWLGIPKRKSGEGLFTLYYRFDTTSDFSTQRKIKIEINTREHFSILAIAKKEFIVDNPWFNSTNIVNTYKLEELIATKLRALYQRKKGRDLFDIWLVLQMHPKLEAQKVIECFKKYIVFENKRISKAGFENNLLLKKDDPVFTADLSALLINRGTIQKVKNFRHASLLDYAAQYNVPEAIDMVMQLLIAKM